MIYVAVGVASLLCYYFRKKNAFAAVKNFWAATKRDFLCCFNYMRVVCISYSIERNCQTIPKLLAKQAKINPNKVAIYFEDEMWTFQEIEDFSNKVANYFKQEGYKRKDVVVLFLQTCPEYVCMWLGLAKIGVITALVNHNLVGDVLTHSLKISHAKAVIYGSTLKEAIKNIAGEIPHMKLYELQENDNKMEISNTIIDLRNLLESQSERAPSEEIEKGKVADEMSYMYTSGTTGFPKAAIITQKRVMYAVTMGRIVCKYNEKDVLYDCLPLYHLSGGGIPVGLCITLGIPIVLKQKFSASKFWDDCIRYKCTVVHYIGEICRYLLVAHKNSNAPVVHSVRFFIGNGLSPEIWKDFVQKFQIPHVYEFYGSTEGNANIINPFNQLGAVGYLPTWLSFYPLKLIKCEIETGLPIRGKDGLCHLCQPGEAGLFVGKINRKSILNMFKGYADAAENKKKIINNVVKHGDSYFNTGDILVRDEKGFFYFTDRIGDTFRWKGENVATAEVQSVISNILDLNDTVVYGVEVPECSGKVGMLALRSTPCLPDMKQFAQDLRKHLPNYAIPRFVRITDEVQLTGTYKLKKVQLQKEGFNIDVVRDKIFVYDANISTYVELTKEMYENITAGKIKF